VTSEPTGVAWSPREQRWMHRATLVFPASGRLGNQLFQYSAVRSFMTERQRLVLVDFDDLDAVFTGVRAGRRSSTSASDRARLSFRYRSRRLFGSPIGLISADRAEQVPEWVEAGSVATVRGFFQRDGIGHAQHVGALKFRPEIVGAADTFLQQHLPARSRGPVAFVHVRRGDYLRASVGPKGDGLGWVPSGPSVALSADWYRARMAEMRVRLPGVRFLLVGDDPGWARGHLSGADTVVSDQRPGVDLALLGRCDAGILSASSFAWWGAWFAKRNGGGPFLAPLYWLGHAAGDWWPVRSEVSWMEYRASIRDSGLG
jgi:hypothetical protein